MENRRKSRERYRLLNIKLAGQIVKMNRYKGSELELFQSAENWKAYWSSKILAESDGDALEIGAGIGGNSTYLLPKSKSLTLSEPDEFFFKYFLQDIARENDKICAVEGTISDIDLDMKFDQIYYIDVLEHISNDKQEIINATKYLKKGGSIYLLVPAYKILYSNFDRSVGHFRRYNKMMITNCIPMDCVIVEYYFLDSLGALASLGNKMFSRNSAVTRNKILFWDKILIPVSIKIDRLIGYKFGKSIFVRIKHK